MKKGVISVVLSLLIATLAQNALADQFFGTVAIADSNTNTVLLLMDGREVVTNNGKIPVGRQKFFWPGMDQSQFRMLEIPIRPGMSYEVGKSSRGYYLVQVCESRNNCHSLFQRLATAPGAINDPWVARFYFQDELDPNTGVPKQ